MEKYIVKNAGKILDLKEFTTKPKPQIYSQQSVDGMPLPVTVTQPANKPVYVNQRARFSRKYCMSFFGFLRIAIMVKMPPNQTTSRTFSNR